MMHEKCHKFYFTIGKYKYWGGSGGLLGSIVASQQEGPGFESWLSQEAFIYGACILSEKKVQKLFLGLYLCTPLYLRGPYCYFKGKY